MADEFEPSSIKLLPEEKDRAVLNIKKNLPLVLNTLRGFLEHQFTFVKDGEFSSEAAQDHSLLALGNLLLVLVVCLFIWDDRGVVAVFGVDSDE